MLTSTCNLYILFCNYYSTGRRIYCWCTWSWDQFVFYIRYLKRL